MIIPNRAVFEAKREAIVSGGVQKLQIVSDFDRTITAFHDTHGMYRMQPSFPPLPEHALPAQASRA